SSGSTLSDQGTHILNYGMSLNGDAPVESVFGTVSGPPALGHIQPDLQHTAGAIVFANGVRALWVTGPTAPRCGEPSVPWQHVRIAAYAARGRVLWEEFGRWEVWGTGEVAGGDYGGMETWRHHNLLAQAAFHNAMFDWLEDASRVPGTALKQSLHEWKAVLALHASALWRRPVQMEHFDPGTLPIP
ncbi:MAG: hypothetical protein QHJ73_19790, partial [Armatimonadota bacterium]|nr:hypothetical protein [Armatimonadota bacterium]